MNIEFLKVLFRSCWHIILMMCVFLGLVIFNATYVEYIDIDVTDKNIKTVVSESGSKTRYMIFSEQGTFNCVDSWLEFHFRSSEVFGMIEKGRSYSVKTRGLRIPFFSMFPNIVIAREVVR